MDFFGISAALQAVARIYFRTARQTGRTTSLLKSVKSGDRVVFSAPLERQRFEGLCKRHGIEVSCIVIDPRSPEDIYSNGPVEGRTIFDHGWLESFYTICLEDAQARLAHIEREASGMAVSHVQSDRSARELSRWNM